MTFDHWSRERSKESPGSGSYERNSSRALLINFSRAVQFSVEIRSDQIESVVRVGRVPWPLHADL